jgi:CBS domain-containing protein
VGAVLVEDGGRLCGILSERDVLRRVIPQALDVGRTPVREVMTTGLLTVRPEQWIKEAMRLMTEKRVRHLPVVEGDRVIGLVSIGDLTKWMSRDLEQEVYELSSYIVGAYVIGPFLA